MSISNYYWYFTGVLTPKFCDDVIAYANQQEEVMARTGGYGLSLIHISEPTRPY